MKKIITIIIAVVFTLNSVQLSADQALRPIAAAVQDGFSQIIEGRLNHRGMTIFSGGEYAAGLVEKFHKYTGEVYYSCALYNKLSLVKLILLFPNASRVVLNDKFDPDKTSRPTIPKPDNVYAIADEMYREFKLLSENIGGFHVRIIDKRTIEITINVEKENAKVLLKRDGIKVLYKIGDLTEDPTQYGIIHVQQPGMGGGLSEKGEFWLHIMEKLEDGGSLLVDGDFQHTFPPLISGVSNVAEIGFNRRLETFTSSGSWKVFQRQADGGSDELSAANIYQGIKGVQAIDCAA